FELALSGTMPGPVIASPNGQRIAYIADSGDGIRSIWVRPIASDAAQKLSGTDNVVGSFGFWSPDSRYIGFVADGKLKKVDVSAGAVQVICDFAPPIRGLSWSRDGVILLAKSGPGGNNIIARVSDSGGEVTNVTALDSSRKETVHVAPD